MADALTDPAPAEPPTVQLVLPAIPPTPPQGADWQTWDIYLRSVQINNSVFHSLAVATQGQAMSQQATAINRAAQAQEQTVAALNAPPPVSPYALPSEAQLVEAMLRGGYPSLSTAQAAVRAFLAAYKPPKPFQP